MGPLVSISFAHTSLVKDTLKNTATLGYVQYHQSTCFQMTESRLVCCIPERLQVATTTLSSPACLPLP